MRVLIPDQKTFDAVFSRGVADDTMYLFQRGVTFNTKGIHCPKDRVQFNVIGKGAPPILKYSGPSAGYPKMFYVTGKHVTIAKLAIDGSGYKELRAIQGDGCWNLVAEQIKYKSIGTLFHWNAAEQCRLDDCGPLIAGEATLKYGEYFEHQAGRKNSEGMLHNRCVLMGSPTAHALRCYGVDQGSWLNCTIGRGVERSAVTLKDGLDLLFFGTTVHGNVGAGDNIPLGTDPSAKLYKVRATFNDCTVKLKDTSVFTLRRDTVVAVNRGTYQTPAPYCFELKHDAGFTDPRITIKDATVLGPQGVNLLKGLTQNATVSGVTVRVA
jgi:hypothetical protein